MTPWVVKLGGSLAGSAELSRWLDVLTSAGAGRIVLVPGGGPWANEVRAAQAREAFDDRVAHHKALRAMEQFGKVLAGMRTLLVPATDAGQMHAIRSVGQIPVWMPYDMVVADTAIVESWDVTSDSLAAWLARRLDARGLLLLKSMQVDTPPPDVAELGRRGWVDAAFAEFTAGLQARIVVLGAGDQQAAERLLVAEGPKVLTNSG